MPLEAGTSIEGDVVGIEPGVTGIIDGKKVFPSLTVKFGKDHKALRRSATATRIPSSTKQSSNQKYLSSIAAEGDGTAKDRYVQRHTASSC